MSNQGQSSSPLPSSRQTTPASSDSGVPKSFPCSCGKGDGTGDYIECDNPDCRVGWYHWKCVQVAEEPIGTWLCPSCSPSAAFYTKQLVKTRAVTPLTPKPRKATSPTASEEKDPESPAKEKVARKGVAVKKSMPEKPKPKPKPKWVGWIELPSDDEEEYKKQVDAKWMENSVKGKRRGASKALSEEDGTGSRRLRARSKPGETVTKAVETDSEDEESVYQQEEEEEEEEEKEEKEEEKEEERASISEEASVRDEESANEEASDPHEDMEDTMDMEADREESLEEANGSDQSGVSEYVDADDASGSSIVFLDECVVISDDSMGLDAEHEDQDHHQSEVFVTVAPPVESKNHAALYRRQGNCWGEFPESAIRSTLPRLA